MRKKISYIQRFLPSFPLLMCVSLVCTLQKCLPPTSHKTCICQYTIIKNLPSNVLSSATVLQFDTPCPPILELAARYSMFLIIHNMCTVFIRKYFRLLLCNQFGNETLFGLKQLYFVNLVVFIHPMCVMCTSLKKLLDIFYYYNFLQGDGEEDDQGSGTRRRKRNNLAMEKINFV